MSETVKLSIGNFIIIVDAEDVPRIKKYTWGVWNFRNKQYVQRTIKFYEGNKRKSKSEKLHRYLIGAKPGEIVDHINGNSLDNRKSNLRITSHAVNMQNSKVRSDNSIGHKGIYFCKQTGTYRPEIQVNGKRYRNLGRYATLELAIQARKQAEIKFGFDTNFRENL